VGVVLAMVFDKVSVHGIVPLCVFRALYEVKSIFVWVVAGGAFALIDGGVLGDKMAKW